MTTTPKDDTPRTDSTEGSEGSQRACDNLANLARTLERELAKAKAAIEAMPTCRCGMSTDDQCLLADMLKQAKKEIESLKENRDDLLILTKSWAIVWGDKISPKSLELFSQLEAKALGNAATLPTHPPTVARTPPHCCR